MEVAYDDIYTWTCQLKKIFISSTFINPALSYIALTLLLGLEPVIIRTGRFCRTCSLFKLSYRYYPRPDYNKSKMDKWMSNIAEPYYCYWDTSYISKECQFHALIDVFFDLLLNKRLSKQPWGWWFETPSWPLWRQCNDHGLWCYASWAQQQQWHWLCTIKGPCLTWWNIWTTCVFLLLRND